MLDARGAIPAGGWQGHPRLDFDEVVERPFNAAAQSQPLGIVGVCLLGRIHLRSPFLSVD